MILTLLFAGVVELGNLINIYLDIIDSAREAARYANAVSLYMVDPNSGLKYIGEDVYDKSAQVAWATLNPACTLLLPAKPGAANCSSSEMKLDFNPATDDIVISILSYDGNSLLRFPSVGWSRFGNHISTVTDAEIIAKLDPTAPNTGLVTRMSATARTTPLSMSIRPGRLRLTSPASTPELLPMAMQQA